VSIPAIEFHVSTADVGEAQYVVSLAGEADLYSAPALREELDRVVARGGRRVIVDLAGATFVDSTALAVFAHAHGRLREAGGELVLVSDDRRIVRTFEIAGLRRIFTLEKTLRDALSRPAPRRRR
jgi:anti-sigma B factor antagonist